MSTNVSKEKREKLVEKIKAIKHYIATAPQDENTAQLLTYIADIEKDIKGKKYGLVFEEHRESIDEILDSHVPVLTEDESLFINNGGQMNFLIEGDNLASLQLLEKTHKGKIDLIYIDPPYFRGKNDFRYDDNFVSPDDSFRHSKWCSLITKRINIAKRLLSRNGVIFISIDDNEVSQLKLICDEEFGNENFIACLPTIMNLKGNQDELGFAGTHEYTLVYARDFSNVAFNQFHENEILDDWQQDSTGFYKKGATLKRTGNDAPRSKRPYGYFPILVNKSTQQVSTISKEEFQLIYSSEDKRFDDEFVLNLINKYENEGFAVLLPEIEQEKTSWRWSHDKVQNEQNEIIVVENNGCFSLYKKQRPELGDFPTKKPKSIFYKPTYSSGNGTAQLKDIFDGKKVFDNPKPIELIKDFILIGSKKDSIILDFFAGSGTTGHAVMKLNAEDGGKRKFILCTNNENSICRDVTYERIKRVINKEDYKASLKYFKVDYLPISDKLYYEYADELLKHIKELVELENGINFNGNTEIAIILTEEELDEFTTSLPEDCCAIYLGHDVLPSKEQETLFKKKNITVNIIPDYYYKDLEG